jgi:diguanylate cyclase (GGDEF)-like protein
MTLGGLISALVPKISSQLRVEIGFVPQLLVGFVILALVFYLHLASQRQLLGKVSTALIAATSYVDRLEQCSFVDPQTQLFNRRYLDQLFNQQLKWLNRSGKSATLILFEVVTDGKKSSAEEIAISAALVLRSNFRGSDYVVRNAADQFLVLLPDTTEDQAQFAMNRLTDKIENWNLENERSEMVLRHEINACPPGCNLWEKLSEVEDRLRDKTEAGVIAFTPPKLTPVTDRGFAVVS